MTQLQTCKNGQAGCGQYYDCGSCSREKRARAYRRLTPAQKAYDDYVDPLGAYHENFEAGCSCHINAPCGYCTREVDAEDRSDNPELLPGGTEEAA